MQTPSLNHFETFLCVAEQSSFTKAAKQLGISKAAVSRTIRFLETAMQVPLFIRNTRNIYLTEEGEVLFTQCQRLKEELDCTRNAIHDFKKQPTGTLKISTNPYFAKIALLGVLKKYLQQFPEMHVEIMTEERVPDMSSEHIDIVFGINWPAPLDIVAKTIAKTRYVFCASPQYLEENGTPTKISELEQQAYIPHLGRPSNNVITGLKNTPSLNINAQLKVNQTAFMKECALNDMGIIQLHEYMLRDELAEGTLVEILDDEPKLEIPIYIYFQKHRFVQPKIRQFIHLFNDHADEINAALKNG